MSALGYVDLGLPSGTLWRNTNESGYYTHADAVSQFGKNLPTKEQAVELKDYCQWTWIGNGYKIKGRNGNTITLPAEGTGSTCSSTIHAKGEFGIYWYKSYDDVLTVSASEGINPAGWNVSLSGCSNRNSVRLVSRF